MKLAICFVVGFSALALTRWDAWAGEKDTVKATNLEKVNTDADEDDPFVLGESLWYASNKSGNFELLIAKRAGVNWQAGKVVLSDKDTDYRSPFYYPKNSTLYFATNWVDEKFKGLKNFDIQAKIREQKPLPLPGISEKEDEL